MNVDGFRAERLGNRRRSCLVSLKLPGLVNGAIKDGDFNDYAVEIFSFLNEILKFLSLFLDFVFLTFYNKGGTTCRVRGDASDANVFVAI